MSSPATVEASRINDIVGAQNVATSPGELSFYAVDGIPPQIAARPANAQEVSELVRFAAAEEVAVIPTGACTKLGIGMPPARYDLAIDTRRLDSVISYDPGDLTLSVEPGIPLPRLAAALAKHNQFLPLAVPYSDRSTIGGTLASGIDSPLRQFYGTARDFVLGMEFVSGEGALTKSGGRVVKNVSGYDLHKLFLGSIGSLGIITRINFKTFPLPSSRRGFVAACPSLEEALALRQRMSASPISPATLEILSPEMAAVLLASQDASPALSGLRSSATEWFLLAALFGSNTLLDRGSSELERMADPGGRNKTTLLSGSEQEMLWFRLYEAFRLLVESSPASIIVKIAVLPSRLGELSQFLASESARYQVRSAALIRGTGVVYWAFLPDSPQALQEKAAVRQILPAGEGRHFRSSILACPSELKSELSVWGPPREDFILHQRVKRAFDPHCIFAPGRFVGGL